MLKQITNFSSKNSSLTFLLKKHQSTSQKTVKLLNKIKLNHDCFMFRFELGPNVSPLEYKPGSHFIITGLNDINKEWKKKYTPIQPIGKNYFDSLIKIYRPNVHPIYPKGGELTPLLEQLEIGENILIDGPLISIHYQGNGKFHIKRSKQSVDKELQQTIEPKHILFIAGGTGVAPFFSMIQEMVREKNDKTKITLLFGNKSKQDVVLKNELDEFAKLNKNIKIVYTIDSVEEGDEWDGEIGSMNEFLIQKYAGDPKDDGNYVMICGTTGMNKVCLKAASNLGFDPYHYFRF